MKKITLALCILFGSLSLTSMAQESKILTNKDYHGAVAKKKSYKAIYQLDSNDPKTITKAIRNINNVLKDPRLKGKIEIELITFSGGTEAYLKKNSEYEQPLKDLISKGVIVAQCLNSLEERKLTKDELFDFVAYVPSGNGELIIRANEGWVIIKP